MARNDTTSAVVDAVLGVAVLSGAITIGLMTPNVLLALDKPMKAYFDKLDRRAQERELRRIVGYMKRQKLLADDYEHGLQITDKGKQRLRHKQENDLRVNTPETWDKKWRLVLFDVPEQHNGARQRLTAKLRQLGFQPLQQSAWIHPFPCMEVVEILTVHLELERYVSCLEVTGLTNEKALIKRFSHLISEK